MGREILDEEVLREIASVGGSIGERLERCIARLCRLSKIYGYLRLRLSRGGASAPSIRMMIRVRKEFAGVRDEALRLRKELIIYREAIGLVNHREVYDNYDIESISLS